MNNNNNKLLINNRKYNILLNTLLLMNKIKNRKFYQINKLRSTIINKNENDFKVLDNNNNNTFLNN
jgi:hypothetical protein